MALARLGRRAVLLVIELLQHEDPWVRHLAANILGGIRDKRVIDALAALLRDPDAWVRKTAVEALEENGDPGYWESHLAQPSRGTADPRCVERCFILIVDCLDDPDEWVRQQATFWRERGYGAELRSIDIEQYSVIRTPI